MRKIELKVIGSGNDELDYRQMLIAIASMPADPSVGMTIEEIRKCSRVLDLLEDAECTESVYIEDADYSLLLYKVRNFRWHSARRSVDDWRKAQKNIDEFVRDIEQATSMKKSSKEEKEE